LGFWFENKPSGNPVGDLPFSPPTRFFWLALETDAFRSALGPDIVLWQDEENDLFKDS
jgi:hypothetical protein